MNSHTHAGKSSSVASILMRFISVLIPRVTATSVDVYSVTVAGEFLAVLKLIWSCWEGIKLATELGVVRMVLDVAAEVSSHCERPETPTVDNSDTSVIQAL